MAPKRNKDLGILGLQMERGDLKEFKEMEIQEYNEDKIKNKVKEMKKKEQIKIVKKKPTKKLLGALTDPKVFNGISKGYTLMTMIYHFTTYKKMASESFKNRLKSLLSL